jgi:hypothetical protein
MRAAPRPCEVVNGVGRSGQKHDDGDGRSVHSKFYQIPDEVVPYVWKSRHAKAPSYEVIRSHDLRFLIQNAQKKSKTIEALLY